MTDFLGLYNYWIVIFLMMTGFYIVIARENLIKTIIGLNIFQTSVFLLYITMGKVTGGTAPILKGSHSGESHGGESHGAEGHGVEGHGVESHGAEHGQELHSAAEGHLDSGVEAVTEIYSNPIPSVLMLTAIVVGIATTALALALVVRIREEYGTIEEDEILEMDRNS